MSEEATWEKKSTVPTSEGDKREITKWEWDWHAEGILGSGTWRETVSGSSVNCWGHLDDNLNCGLTFSQEASQRETEPEAVIASRWESPGLWIWGAPRRSTAGKSDTGEWKWARKGPRWTLTWAPYQTTMQCSITRRGFFAGVVGGGRSWHGGLKIQIQMIV